MRLESVQNATDHGRHVAEMILGGSSAYAGLPWFWSNQGPLRLQIAGLTRPGTPPSSAATSPAGGSPSSASATAGWSAVESLNRPADHIAARRVLAAGQRPTPEQAADPAFSLKDHAKQLA